MSEQEEPVEFVRFERMGERLAAQAGRVTHCEGCGREGEPLTSGGYCPSCADITCQVGSGARIGLPVPADVPAALRALERHQTVEHPGPEHGECLVCRLYGLAIVCTQCDAEPGEGDHTVVCGHVVLGCEGYVTAAVCAAALLPVVGAE